jgi:hypothetical protein
MPPSGDGVPDELTSRSPCLTAKEFDILEFSRRHADRELDCFSHDVFGFGMNKSYHSMTDKLRFVKPTGLF